VGGRGKISLTGGSEEGEESVIYRTRKLDQFFLSDAEGALSVKTPSQAYKEVQTL